MLIFALVHDSIIAEVKDEYVDMYSEKLRYYLQKDRGLNFKGFKIKVDIEIGQDYSFV